MENPSNYVREFLASGGLGGGRSASALRRWLDKKYGIKVSYKKAVRLLEGQGLDTEWVIENEWEALGQDGKVVKLRQTKAKVRPRVDWKAAIRAFVDEAIEPVVLKQPKISGELVGVLSIPDVHVGKLAWEPEVGAAYDTKRAAKLYVEAGEELATRLRASGVGRVVYIVGNDLLHVDGGLYPATTKGTIQDTDTRWQYAFRRAKASVVSVAMALAEFSEVDIIVAPGNHDRVLSFALGEVIQAYFAHVEHVRVDSSPRYRKYVRYDGLLFGITHGDLVKPHMLPSLMATEVPEFWGASKYREWFLGHIHKKKELMSVGIDDHFGVRLRYLPSLAAQDRWHYEMGYKHFRSAEAHVYSTSGFPVSSFYYSVGGE